MVLIAVTPEKSFRGELEYIQEILNDGFDYVHIRKPSFSADEMRQLIERLPQNIHARLRLHSHFELAKEYGIGGIHLNSHNNNNVPEGLPMDIKKSKSCHSLEELSDSNKYEYVFLSPIYDSISKKGYKSQFNITAIQKVLCCDSKKTSNVIALGGVAPEHLKELKNCGFYGAAFLGFLFNCKDLTQLRSAITLIKQQI